MSIETLLGISVLLFGLMSGTYFAFSIVVMPALKQLPANAATDVMKQINSDILKSMFMLVFWLSTFIALLFIFIPVHWAMVLSGAIYVVGMFGITAVCNVPLNKTLATATAETSDKVWASYMKYWTGWNHVRTICSFCALALSVYTLIQV